MGLIIQLFVWLSVCSVLAFAAPDVVSPDLVIAKAQKNVDLTTQLPKIVTQLTLENAGQSGLRYVLVAADPGIANGLSFVGASVSG